MSLSIYKIAVIQSTKILKLYVYFSSPWQSQSKLCPRCHPIENRIEQDGNVRLQWETWTLLISCINKDDLEVYTDYKQINEQKMIPLHYVTDLNRVNYQKKVCFWNLRIFLQISRFSLLALTFFDLQGLAGLLACIYVQTTIKRNDKLQTSIPARALHGVTLSGKLPPYSIFLPVHHCSLM